MSEERYSRVSRLFAGSVRVCVPSKPVPVIEFFGGKGYLDLRWLCSGLLRYPL